MMCHCWLIEVINLVYNLQSQVQYIDVSFFWHIDAIIRCYDLQSKVQYNNVSLFDT